MKKICLIALVASVLVISKASALPVYMDSVNGYNESGYSSAGGGEFNASGLSVSGYSSLDVYNNSLGQQGFGTFCIARNLLISPGNTYAGSVDPNGLNPGTGQQIAVGTAWLYQQFATGVLTGYNYNPGVTQREVSAYNLQNAIWYLEGQLTLSNPLNNPFLSLVNTRFGSLSNAEGDNNLQFAVGVLDLSYNGNTRQPMLALVSVPDSCATLLLMGLSVSGMLFVSRRFGFCA